MSRCLVTGAAGLIGAHLVNHLLDLGHDVVAVDDLSNGEWPKEWSRDNRITVVELDITSPEAAATIAAMKPFSVCYHLACAPYEGLSQFCPRFVSDSVVGGTVNVLRACINAGTVRRFVNTSSMARYGSGQCVQDGRIAASPPPFVEDKHLTIPEDVYGIAKVSAEMITEVLCDLHGIEWCHAVPHNVVGEANLKALSDPYRGVLLIWTNQLLRGQEITVFGDGEQKRAPSYVGDVVPALAKMGFADQAVSQAINLGGATEYTINEMRQELSRSFCLITGKPSTFYRTEDSRPREVVDAWCSVEKSQRLLDYKDKTSLGEICDRIVRWAYSVAPDGVELRYMDRFEIEAKAPKVWLERRM